MERIPVWMTRSDLKNIPEHPLPEGFRFRMLEDGDRETWSEICFEAGGMFDDMDKARATFDKDFGGHEEELKERCFFVVDEATGKTVATTTAWYDHKPGEEDPGRIHWVAVRKDYQGRKLARPMLAEAMRFLAKHHTKGCLATNTGCARAIGIYLDFGFEPALTTERWEEAWSYLANELKHPALARFQ